MLKRFRNSSIRFKMILGSLSVIVVMMLAVGLGMFELNRNKEEVTLIDSIIDEEYIVFELQSALNSTRLDYEQYLMTSEESYVISFDENIANMRRKINEYRALSDNDEHLDIISDIEGELVSYSNNFKTVVDVQNLEAEVYIEVGSIGNEMLSIIRNILNISQELENIDLYNSANNVNMEILNSRLAAFKFYVSHEEDDFQSFVKVFQKLSSVSDSLLLFSNDSMFRSEILQYAGIEPDYLEGMYSFKSIFTRKNDYLSIMAKQGTEIHDMTDQILNMITNEKNIIVDNVSKDNLRSSQFMSVISLIAVVASLYITLSLLKLLLTPITALTSTFTQISEGEIDLDFRLPEINTGELGQMSLSFNAFMIRLSTIMKELQYQDKIKTAQGRADALVRDSDDIFTISQGIITYICNNHNFPIGALFMKGDNDKYRLVSSYAYSNRKGFNEAVDEGDGVVGQVILEKKPIIMNNVPNDYIAVQSGLGEIPPTNIAVFPCIYEGEVKCIIEIGSFDVFGEEDLILLEALTNIAASSIHFAEVDNKMKTLLNKTLQQSEELKMQQEELQQSNEELEEQARELMASESKLQIQQEELKVSNDELAEQAKALEEQKIILDKSNEELLVSQKQILEKAEALEVSNQYKSEFLANMSHELRTPLNSILVLSQLLSDRDQSKLLTSKEIEFAQTINSSGSDLLTIINDILDLSKVEAGYLDINNEDVSLKDLLKQNHNLFAHVASEKGIGLRTELGENLPTTIKTDSLRLNQIIKNLISNALKFTDEGEVVLKIRNFNEFEKSTIKSDNGVTIEVSDTGIGISKEKHDHIFEAFKQSDGTTSRKYGGTGLGLTISKQLSHLLGGDIFLESSENEGSTFAIVIPYDISDKLYENVSLSEQIKSISIDVGDEVKDDKKTEKPKAVIKESIKIKESVEIKESNIEKAHLLIIEDDVNFAKVLASLSEEKGYRVSVANTGAEGKSKAILLNPDAIILDIGLPDINGITLAKELSKIKETKHTPIHIISGQDDDNLTMPNSVIGYLQKPVDIRAIYDTLGKIEEVTAQDFSSLLVVGKCGDEDFENFRKLGDVDINRVETGSEAFDEITKGDYQCIIVDLELDDMSGVDFIKKMNELSEEKIPVVIYTDREVSDADLSAVDKYADSVILKSSKSTDRLVDEVSLFLHNFESKTEETVEVKLDMELTGKKVLLVDDDERNVFALTNLLENIGMDVINASDGNECIKVLEDNSDINIILMDIMMPNLDGYETIKVIRSLNTSNSQIPIITLTAKAMQGEREKSIAAGASDYLTKPVDVDKLISTLKVWL